MESDECDYIEIKNGICKYFIGNKNNPRDIECCHNHCSLIANKDLMQDDIQPLVRRHGAMTQKHRSNMP